MLGIGKYSSHEDLIGAFALRSKQLVTHETLGEYIATASPDEKHERLLFVENDIVGAENKRLPATYVIAIITASNFEIHFILANLSLLKSISEED